MEDDDTVAEVVGTYLRAAGMTVTTARDGLEALRAVAAAPPGRGPDLVVLDRMLPGLDGVEVCRRLRAAGGVRVVLLTALGAQEDRIEGLEAGADDYLTKPFSPRELVLRVQSVLRRGPDAGTGRDAAPDAPSGRGPEQAVVEAAGLRLDPAARTAHRHGRPLALTGREFDLLLHLLRHPGRAFDRTTLLAEVWGWTHGDASTVTVHVRRLRAKVEDDPAHPRLLVTVWGVGYRLDVDPPPDPPTGPQPGPDPLLGDQGVPRAAAG